MFRSHAIYLGPALVCELCGEGLDDTTIEVEKPFDKLTIKCITNQALCVLSISDGKRILIPNHRRNPPRDFFRFFNNCEDRTDVITPIQIERELNWFKDNFKIEIQIVNSIAKKSTCDVQFVFTAVFI